MIKNRVAQKINELLPIGSVVLLKDGEKRLMIFGILQSESEDAYKTYDYIGVMYPEGCVGAEHQYLFQHKDIEKVFFKGYEDKERKEFLTNLEEALVEGGWFNFDEVCIGVLQYLHDMKDSENKMDINLNEIASRFAIDEEAANSIINTLENDGLIKAKLFGGKKYVITPKGIAMVNVG